MFTAELSHSREIFECDNFKTLYRNVLLSMIYDISELPCATIYVNGIPKYELVTWLWHIGDDKSYSIDLVRHSDGNIMTVRNADYF